MFSNSDSSVELNGVKEDDDSTATYFIDVHRESSGNDKSGCIKPLAVLARGANLVSLLAPATKS